MKQYITDDPTIIIYYDEDIKDRIKELIIDEQKLFNEIKTKQQNCNYHTEDNEWGLACYYDWSTGLEFSDHIGGGYIISIEEDWYNGKVCVEVYAEWYDSYAKENGYEKCKDMEGQIKDAIIQLNRFIKRI